MKHKIIATDQIHLKNLIKAEISSNGHDCDLNHIDVSNIVDMNGLFARSEFNGNIRDWNVSNVTDMSLMFYRSSFCGNLFNWDVRNVTNMTGMFYGNSFYGDISNWKPYKIGKNNKLFNSTSIIRPYWEKFDNDDERRVAINAYHLEKFLNIENTSKTKLKI